MLIIGSHVSFSSEQLLGCVKQSLGYGANAFMFYTGAPQNTLRNTINPETTAAAHALMQENDFSIQHVICHAPYIINLANNLDPSKYDFSIKFLKGEITRCKALGVKYLVLHPGSSVGQEKMIAINNIINGLNEVADDEVMILLETMAGKGTEIGITLDEIKMIIDGVNKKDRFGVCLDSCHLNDSGLDLTLFDEYLNEFEEKIGLHKIKCFHLNDSKNIMGAHKDRHENIGYGMIGFDTLIKLAYHEKLKLVPKILETPYINKKPPYLAEIKMIKAKCFNPNLITDVTNS